MNNQFLHTKARADRPTSISRSSVSLTEIPQRHHHGRQKQHLSWERIELATGGRYTDYLNEIARHYPELSPTELKVCALVKAMMASREIAEILGVDERTVENHRTSARRKIGLAQGRALLTCLASI